MMEPSSDRESLLRHREIQTDGLREACREYDKAILGLSSAFLAGSVAFLGQSASSPDARWALVLGWVLLTGAITATLISFQASSSDWWHEIRLTDQRLNPDLECALKPRLAKATASLNWIAGGCFVVGIASVALFKALNL